MDLEKEPNISNKGMDFIPKVKMNYNPAKDMNEETEEDNPQFVYETEDNDSVVEEVEEVEEVESKINEQEIFNDIPIKPKKTRKPMSEEHKAKLKVAREKALAVRRANAQEKKNVKDLEKEEKELVKKKQIKRVQKLKAEVESEEEEIVKPKKVSIAEEVRMVKDNEEYIKLTKKDIEDLQLHAIMGYDAVRKKRKEDKDKEKEENERKEDIHKKLSRAINPRNNFNNYSSYGGF